VEAEAGGGVIGGGGLCFFASGGDAAADTAPEIDFVREIDGKDEITGVAGGADVGAIPRSVKGVNAGTSGDGWKLGARLKRTAARASRRRGFGDFEILVGDGELLFERG